MASMQQLNMLFQAGKCTKPKYEDAQDSSLRWASTVSVTRLSDNKHCFGSGYSTTKQAAREEAAYEVMVEDFNGKKHELRTTYLSPEQVSKAKQARETILKSKMEKQTNDPAIPTEHDQIFVVDGIEHVMLREKREPATCEEMDARFEEILENARKWDCEHAPMPSIQTSQTRVRQCDVCGFWYCPKEDEKTCTPKCGVMINPDDSDSDDEPICECDECEGIVPIGTLHKGTSWRDYEDNGLADALEEARLRSLEDWEEIDTSEGLTTVIPENHEEPEVDMLSWERTNFLNNNRQEMNMTPGVVEQVPRPMLQQQDASVVVDGGLFTNSEVFAPLKINNTDAIALDNPAGTGAPFSKHTAVYKLFQRWEEKNTTINESMAKGTEVVRLSLDPSTWPKNLVEYVMFHKSIIPSLEISIAIAGAAGSIGWMTMGWVRDGSPDKTYTLDDLQQVVCETMSMNGTAIFKTVLNDVRQSGLYRKTIGDPEPYPALILMVDHPVTNVQRNNMVNYPLRVMARLAPHCILMEPFGSPSAPSNTDFYLGSYMMTNQLDLIVGSSSATSDQQPTHNLQDYGFKQGQFKPTVNKDNTFMQNMGDIANNTYAIAFTPEATPSATFLEQLAEAGKNATTSQLKNIIPIRIACAIGDVSLPDDMTTFVGTVYTLEKQQVKLGIYSYSITQMYVQNKGCIVMLDLDCVVNDKFLICTNSVKDVKSQAATSWSFYSENKQVVGTFWQDSTHNNAVVGDDFSYNHGTDDDPRLLLNTYADLKEIKLFVQTGNSIPSTNLPTGLKQIHFTRQGTSSTVTEDSPFSNLDNPIIPNVVKALNKIISEKNWNGIGGDLYVDGQNLGQIGYQNGIFFARSDAYRKIKPGITDDIYIRNLFNLQNGQGLAAFQTNGYQNWGSAGKGYSARTIFLNNMRREAAAIGGGLISGLGNGLTQFGYQQWQSGMMDKVLKNQRAIVDANNIALAERAKQAFERNLELRGYGSASMQHGQAGPRTKEETPSEAFTRFVPGGTLPGGSGTNADSSPLEVSPTIIPPRDVKQATVYRADKGIPPQATPVNVGGKSMISTLNPLAEAFKMPSQPTDGAGVSPTNAPDGQAKD